MTDIIPALRKDIIWTAKTEYYDVDGGEQITKKTATDKTKYIIIKTNKHVELNSNKTRGLIRYTIECRKQPQQKLW